MRLTSHPSPAFLLQFANPGLQDAIPQTPFTQEGSPLPTGGHLKPQLPQLRISDAKSAGVQVPEQELLESVQLGAGAEEVEQLSVILFE